MSVRRTIARNTLFNGMGKAWEAGAGLFLTAYIVYRLGVSTYGLWGLVGAFTGYAALFDLGVGSGYTKYIAEHAARGEKKYVSGIVSTGFFFYAAFGLIFVASGWGALELGMGLLDRLGHSGLGDFGREEVQKDLHFLIRWGLVLMAVSACVAPFTAIQTGLQRMGITNAIGFCSSLLKLGATVAFLELGYGVRGLLYTNAIVLAGFAVASVAAAFYLEPGLSIGPGNITWPTFVKLFRFGWRTQVSRLSNLIMFETDVLVIGLVLRDLQLTGLYKIGVELAGKMRQVPIVLLTALIPAASELDALDEREKLRRLYVVASKYVSLVTLPLVALFAGAAGLLIKTWMGSVEGLHDSANVLRLIAFGYIANVVAGAGITVALGMGRPGLQMVSGLISMTSNIVLTVVLVLTVGFWGIPIATLLSMYISWAWFLGAVGKTVDVRPMRLLKEALLWPVCVSVPPAAFCFLMDYLARDLSGRVANGSAALLAATVTLSTVLLLIRRTPFLDGFDLRFFGETLGLDRVPGFRTWTRPISGE